MFFNLDFITRWWCFSFVVFCLRMKFGRVSPAHGKLGGYGFCCCNKCNACDPFLFDLLCHGVHGHGRQGSTSCEHSHLLPIANRCCVMSSSHPLCWSMALLCRWTLDSKSLLVSKLHELFPQPTSAYFSWKNGSTQLLVLMMNHGFFPFFSIKIFVLSVFLFFFFGLHIQCMWFSFSSIVGSDESWLFFHQDFSDVIFFFSVFTSHECNSLFLHLLNFYVGDGIDGIGL